MMHLFRTGPFSLLAVALPLQAGLLGFVELACALIIPHAIMDCTHGPLVPEALGSHPTGSPAMWVC